jgi:dynein heavy chain
VIEELAIFVESKTPDLFDIDEIGTRYPTDY